MRRVKHLAFVRRGVVLAISLVALVVCSTWLSLEGSQPSPPNVILISLDTCRADYLSCYGRFKGTTPNIDAFANESVLFEDVVSPVPLTFPAHCSMLTGTIPPSHGVHVNIGNRLGDTKVTLAESLRAHGYKTAAILAAAVLSSRTGLNQGFDTYDDRFAPDPRRPRARPERRGDEVADLAVAWLDTHASEPFFLFVHFFDPHDPYEPPEPFASRFPDDPYAGEVAFTDHCVGKVINKLKQLDLYDSSIVVLAGDHGEGLGEHGEPKHGYFIYQNTTKVPLIAKLPGHGKAKRIAHTVSLVDIVPTVLAQVGAATPPVLQGKDLTPFFSGEPAAPGNRFIYSESMTPTRYGCSALLGIESGKWKYIQTTRPELYNLKVDPGETQNLADEHPERAHAFQTRLRSVVAQYAQTDGDRQPVAISSEELSRLRALGYTGGPVEETFDLDTDKEDPKDFVAFHVQLGAMDECRMRNDRAGARRIARQVLAQRSDIVQIHRTLARFATEDGEADTAITHYREALRLAPDSDEAAGWHNNLGILLQGQGQADDAIEHYREALRLVWAQDVGSRQSVLQEDDASFMASVAYSAHLNIGNLLLAHGRADEAADEYLEVIHLRPTDATARVQLSLALAELGDFDGAAEMCRKALRLEPAHPTARQALDDILARRRPSAGT